MHHLAEALDEELIGDLDRGGPGDTPDVVAAEIEQHQVFGAFFLIGQQLGLERLVLLWGSASRARAGERPNGHTAFAHSHQDLRTRAGNRKLAEVEEVEKRCRIDSTQRGAPLLSPRWHRRTSRQSLTAPTGSS